MIDWHHFTPLTSLAGGLLIGISAAIFLLFNGKIAGISGIVGGLLNPVINDIGWRIAFVSGLMIAPLVMLMAVDLPAVRIDVGYPTLIVAGLLVGLGTRFGSGCTSGHGVCGLSRLSPRSMIATVAFMGAGFLTVFVSRHLIN